MIFLICLLILTFFWSLNPFLLKVIQKKLNIYEILFLNFSIYFFFSLLISSYFLYTKKINLNSYTNLNKKDLLIILLRGMIVVITSILFLKLIQMKKVSYVIPHIQALIAIFSLIIGYFFFKEKLNRKEIFFILLIILEIFLINYKK